ncbi:FAD-binding oxidoreductase [Kitasatospora sp. NPDC002227]|uniref:FAD-binding oxidoreductase n=1 Tax=Kitasatospora sp. NPDC002227 TaxID=3154773 RepID=UPI0033186E51
MTAPGAEVTSAAMTAEEALAAAADVLGEETDKATTLGPNVSLYRSRGIDGVLRPRTAEQVRRIVKIFGSSARAGSLHAFSTGGNWGLGSKEPARDGAVVLDLHGLDRVRDLDLAGGWALVEPGVTQARLAKLLAGTGRMLNCTVSSAHTSVLGNALDRGVGLRHQRVEDLLGLEVALPNGELVHVGWWPEAGRTTPVYPHGLGPSLVQFFTQSDFGVVTAAAVRLLPRPEALRVVRLNFAAEQLTPAIDELRRWVAQGLTSGVVKVYNPPAARGYGSAEGEYLVHVCVDGTEASVAALTGVVTAAAEASGLFTQVSATDASDPAQPNHQVAKLVEAAYAGDPDAQDVLFETKMGRPAAELDEKGGFLFFLLLVPFTGRDLARADALLEQVFQETGVRCGATLNALNADLIDCVVTMKYERTEEQAALGHRALDRLYELAAEAGWMPYRLDIDHADWTDRFGDPAARALVRRLKDTVDPNRAVAQGRYA